MQEVKDFNIGKGTTVSKLAKQMMDSGGFTAKKLADGIDIDPSPEPRADSLFQVQFLSTSSIDRSELQEIISGTGRELTYTMNDNDMDGLGDANLDLRVTNVNLGGADEVWAFGVELTSVDFTVLAGVHAFIVNQTDLNTRWDVTYSLAEAGAPTLSQFGDRAESRDWKTGASENLNIDLRMNPEATNDAATPDTLDIRMKVGGVVLTLSLVEAV